MHLDFIHLPHQFLTSPSGFHEALCFLESHLPFCQHHHSFQKGNSILTLITFTMRSIIWHRGNHHFSLLSLTPITFDFNTFACYGFPHLVKGWVLQVPFSLQWVTLDTLTITLSYNDTLSRRNIDEFRLSICS
jgi:hypothetical protein